MSLRVRLAAFSALIMAMVIAERVISIVNLHNETMAAARGEATDLVRQGIAQYELAITATRSALTTLAANRGGNSNMMEQCDNLAAVVESSPQLGSLSIVAPSGIVTCSSAQGAVGLDISKRDYFRIAMRGIGNLGAVQRSMIIDAPSIYMAQPIPLEDGEVTGVMVARIELRELFPVSFSNGLSLSSQAMVVDPEGVVITAYPDERALMGNSLRHTQVVSEALSRTSGTVIAEGPDSVTRLYAYSRLPESNMHLIVGLDLRLVTQQVADATWRAGMTLVAAMAAMLIGLWFVGESLIVAPVQDLSRRLVRFGHGEQDDRSAQKAVIAELEPLANAFEAMTEELTRRESALRNANRRLSSLASLDPLTGIANRRSFDAVFAVQWSTAHQLALLIVDIDHFKAYNDHFGHVEGDRCIRRIAQTLASTVRGTDIVARIGGEEFAVLMPGAAAAGAFELAERLRRAVEGLEIAHAPTVTPHVTVSIGAAACEPSIDLRGTDLMLAADKALYLAKQSGRNRVCAAGPISPDTGVPQTLAAAAAETASRG